MNASWQVIIMALISELTQYFGTWITKWLEGLFGTSGDKEEPIVAEDIIKLGAAPAEVRTALRKRIMDFVTATLGSFPIIGKLAISRISKKLDSIIDGIYDRLFPAEIAAGTLPTAYDFVMPMTTAAEADEPISDSDLAACKAEAGIAS